MNRRLIHHHAWLGFNLKLKNHFFFFFVGFTYTISYPLHLPHPQYIHYYSITLIFQFRFNSDVQMTCHPLLIFFILVSAASVVEGATAAYTPTDVFLFDCGSTSGNIPNDGRWTVEDWKTMSLNSVNASFSSMLNSGY